MTLGNNMLTSKATTEDAKTIEKKTSRRKKKERIDMKLHSSKSNIGDYNNRVIVIS